jgi:enoyl-CoA hydratase/carnithine racemase
VLQFPFVGMALVPEAGSTLLLPRAVGRLRAAEILLTGEPLDAAQALELGLVSRVVPAGEHLDAARAFAARVAAQPAEAVRLTKRLLADDSPGVQPRIAREGTLFLQRLQSPEFVAAVQAFLASRASAREQS